MLCCGGPFLKIHSLSRWLILNNEDPEKELVWLINELKSAEAKGEKVHIIGHIPPGSLECRLAWSKNFDLIVNRFVFSSL